MLEISQASASYHFRVLERTGLVDVVETVQLRGGTARRYRHTSSSTRYNLRDDEGAGDLETRLASIAALAQELQRRVRESGPGPSLSIDAELWVDPATWRRVVRHVGEAASLLHAAAQPPRTPRTVPVSMTTAMFRQRVP